MVRKLTIAYRGLAYAGWQRQENALSVQQVVEEALSSLASAEMTVIAASRTDAGVHARGQVVHFGGLDHLPDRALVHGTNQRLPEDIRILRAESVADGFHARKHALGKLYSYRLIRCEVLSPLDRPVAVQVDPGLDLQPMQEACDALVGEHDFTAFALAGGSHRSPVRTVLKAECREEATGVWFRIEGDGFLRGMVRSVVGTLIEVGSGRRSLVDFRDLLEGAPRSAAGPTAPARGLTLERVYYDALWAGYESRAARSAVVD